MRLINPQLEYLAPETDESFLVKFFDVPYFSAPWHYHSEFELVLIVEGQGKRFVGNSISEFNRGDLSFLGSNLPHLYQNPSSYYTGDPSTRAKSIVIHFLRNSLGHHFFLLPELRKVEILFERAKHGIDIIGEAKELITQKMYELLDASGLKKLIILMEILDILAHTKEHKFISGQSITSNNTIDSGRLNDVLQFVLLNFQREITLSEVASKVYMTRTSFCRFFKDRTKRTFFDLVKELRMTHAAKLLRESDQSVTQVAFSSGYNNLANFNRHFKEKFFKSPLQYRKQSNDI